jgi:hypothetical protein
MGLLLVGVNDDNIPSIPTRHAEEEASMRINRMERTAHPAWPWPRKGKRSSAGIGAGQARAVAADAACGRRSFVTLDEEDEPR